MDTPNQRFIRLIGHKIGSNLNLFEAGSEEENRPLLIAVPESTFEKIFFDKQDVSELLRKYQFEGVFYEYEYFSDMPQKKYADMGILESKAYDFFSAVEPAEREKVYVMMVNQTEFENTYKALFSDSIKRIIAYNPVTGVGTLRKKNFKFKDNQPEFILFKMLYENFNEPVKRELVLKTLHKQEGKTATLAINDIAKKIRTRTGLTTKELVLNNGNITLSI
jgi:hypothetical protein